MTTFSDSENVLPDIAFQGVETHPIASLNNHTIVSALKEWEARSDVTNPLGNLFQFNDTRTFTISYQGDSADFWPDKSVNILGETLVREFLFADGICALEEMSPRLYDVKYKVQAMDDREHLLVCPYPTASGNIAGLLVVCVNKHINALG